MNKLLNFIFFSLTLLLISCGDTSENDFSFVESSEASKINEINRKEAFDYLNAVRNEPAAYSDELGVDLSDVEKRPQLIWNEELATAAYNKVKDMAEKKYFSHVDSAGYGMNYRINEAGFHLADYLLQSKTANSFESIAAGTKLNTGKIMIQRLIIDKDIEGFGHRKHLLGMTDFWAESAYCGIGFYKQPGSRYTHYICVLIARHE
ncbi:CAP domain-containing protein [Ancylomarina sp. 16SWW S1-10-2]|uniref:CAP domain-containing protein n=1 Tax=Ancylomarina sp. 16SWW S1-10-2 TaxID=2499681 RepID=UPI0012AEAE0C|nr:CAP domain-containing protein [Ancylomarina sp. 16SWW S1-10-2]MRT94292.1 CAP domain-containing protein [Ancylomarina sp. 16SWW S1-10-2]